MKRQKNLPFLLGSVVALSLGLTACAANNPSGGGGGGDKDGSGPGTLEVVSWWTSGSEEAALQTLFDGVQKDMDGLKVTNAAVSGGGGSNAAQALNARLQAGDPPDTWQLHPDGQLVSYVAGGQVADVSDLWEKNGWSEFVPDDLEEMQKVDGVYYTVPIAIGRGNVLWTSPSALKEAGVTIDDSTDLKGLVKALEDVKASGAPALCLGDKDIFASSQLLESIIISEIGPENWGKLFTGDLSFDSPEIRSAVETYAKMLDLANSDHSALTWDEAAMRMANGECAANLMGDWAYGEMVNAGKEPGTDFSWVPFPSSTPTFVYVGDGFSIPAKNIPNAEAAKAWLETLMEPEVQLAFSKAKGSIPVMTNVDTSSLSEYQQSASASLQNDAIVSSLAHAQAAGGEFAQIFADAVTTFNGNGSVDAFVSTMSNAQASK